MNVKNILVPIDYSDCGDAAMAYAVSLAKQNDAELHMVHVYQRPLSYEAGGFDDTPLPGILPLPGDLACDLEIQETMLSTIVPIAGVKCRREVLIGSPAGELLDYIKDKHIDLVVMGTHGRTGLKRLLMGSVAEAVLRRSTAPVLAVKAPAKKSPEGSNQSFSKAGSVRPTRTTGQVNQKPSTNDESANRAAQGFPSERRDAEGSRDDRTNRDDAKCGFPAASSRDHGSADRQR